MASYSEDAPTRKGAGKKKATGKVRAKAPSAAAWQGWHHPKSMTVVVLGVHHVLTVLLILGLFGTGWGVTPPTSGVKFSNGTQSDDTSSASGTEFGLLYTRTITTVVSNVTSKGQAFSTAKNILTSANPAGVAAFILLIFAMVLALATNIVLWVIFGHIFGKKFCFCCCPNTNLHGATKYVLCAVFIEFVLVLAAWAEWTGWWLTKGYNLNIRGVAEDAADQRTVQGLRTSLSAVYGALGWSNGLVLISWVLLLLLLLIFSLIWWWWCCCGKREDRNFKATHGGASEAEVSVELSEV
jgi:hypothetical protein